MLIRKCLHEKYYVRATVPFTLLYYYHSYNRYNVESFLYLQGSFVEEVGRELAQLRVHSVTNKFSSIVSAVKYIFGRV